MDVCGEELHVSGRHEERGEDGQVMVARQFIKSYSLPQGAVREKVESNLSQDGVLVITVPKENKIKEIKSQDAVDNIQIGRHHTKSPTPFSTMSSKSASTSSSTTTTSPSKADKNKMNQPSLNNPQKDELSPMTLRGSFFSKDYFDEEWKRMEKSHEEFLANSRKQFDENVRKMRENMDKFSIEFDSDSFDKTLDLPKINHDGHELSFKDSSAMLEIQLDTTGYKPHELRVTVGPGVISVEARHEEKSEAGEVMVSRMMSRQYPLPAQARPAQVVSNLSKDGILVVTVPKSQQIKQDKRDVPINMEN